jgi:hypothetical protein
MKTPDGGSKMGSLVLVTKYVAKEKEEKKPEFNLDQDPDDGAEEENQ